MPAVALSRISTHQTKDSNFDEDLPAYVVIDLYTETDDYGTEKKKSLTNQQFVAGQNDDAHCRHLAEEADVPDSLFIYDDFNIFSRYARLDRAVQKFMPAFLRKAVLDLEHDSATLGHPGARCAYDTMRQS